MYEAFFEMEHTPFTRDIPVDRLYTSPRIEDALGRLVYAADRQMFAVVTANPGCGKSTLIRMFNGRLGSEKYLLLYLPDSKLTPRWLYAGPLGQLGLGPHFFSGYSKRMLQKGIGAVCTEQKKKVVCVLGEAHLLGKGMLEGLRSLLNYKFDSTSPMPLVLVGQTELWGQQLRLQAYTAIRQGIDMNIVLGRLDRAETGKYIAAHLAYAGAAKELFTSDAGDEIYRVSAGIPRMINRICEKNTDVRIPAAETPCRRAHGAVCGGPRDAGRRRMGAGPAGGILFQCTGPAEWGPGERGWGGEIKITRRSINMVEFIIYGKSSCMNGIVGKYMGGQYICIPDINVGCPLSRFSDIFWNKERLCMFPAQFHVRI